MTRGAEMSFQTAALFQVLHRIVLLCVALVSGLTLTHVLQSPGSRGLSGSGWLAVQHTFYGGFAVVGGAGEIIGLIAAARLAMLGRRTLRTALLGIVSAFAMLGCLAAFVFGNRPANDQIASWTPGTLPGNWSATRNSWEIAHTVSAVLSLIALLVMIHASRPRTEP